MRKKRFNPNTVAVPNGNYFAFPYEMEESDLCLLSVPWDVTTSYGGNAAEGPEAIVNASAQLDFFDFEIEKAWELPCATVPIDTDIKRKSAQFKHIAQKIIALEERGIDIKDDRIKDMLKEINNASAELNQLVEKKSIELLERNKVVGLVGGDHSTPYGLIKALSKKHEEFGILHIDAHADLRKAYEGFKHSHASIMYNSIQLPQVSKLVQVGIRDLCEEEYKIIENDCRIELYDDHTISEFQFSGQSWSRIIDSIIAKLPEKIYISFDVDGLDPSLCPNTGTPVPGGLSYNQAIHLLNSVRQHDREIIGFDLCEVSPGPHGDEWDANVGARILYKLCCLTSSQFRD